MTESRNIAETESEDHKNETQGMQWLNNDPLDLRCVNDPKPVDTAEVIAGFSPDALDDHCDSLTREADEVERLDYPDYEADFYNDSDNY